MSVLEMDGAFDKLEELIYVESHLSNTSTKFYGEITQQMLKNSHFPGQPSCRSEKEEVWAWWRRIGRLEGVSCLSFDKCSAVTSRWGLATDNLAL